MDAALPLDWLCCPRSGQALRRASAEELAQLEAARAAGALRFEQEPAVQQLDLGLPISGALAREDGALFYIVEKGVPVLLPDHAVARPPSSSVSR